LRRNPNEAAALKRAGGFFFGEKSMRYRSSAWPAVLSSQARPLARTSSPPARGVGDGRGSAAPPADIWHFENALRQLDRMSVYGDDTSVTIDADNGMVLEVDDSGDGFRITEVPED
jgi:hypothetical protein